MKEYIRYYYSLFVTELRFVNGKYYFSDGKDEYLLEPIFFYGEDLHRIYQNYLSILSFSNLYHEIVKSVFDTISVTIEKKQYLLLKLKPVPSHSLQLDDLKNEWNYSFFPQGTEKIPWANLWEQKIDYFEELFVSGKSRFSIEPDLFFYFIGMGEVAISYYRETLRTLPSQEAYPLVPSHRRVSSKMTFTEYYDPVFLIFDYRVRDVAEYIKNSFWFSELDWSSIESFLSKVSFRRGEAQLFLSRLLFPSFYFDTLEEGKNQFLFYERVEEYQTLLSFIYQFLYEKYQIDEIFWLKKKM